MKDLLLSYNQLKRNFTSREYLLSLLGIHISPVVLASKPAVFINITNIVKKNLVQIWDREKKILFAQTKLKYEEMNRKQEGVSVLIYHPNHLSAVFQISEHVGFLHSFGYPDPDNLSSNIQFLKKRIYGGSFPHEVGLFLGIPLAEVRIFMHNPEKKPLMTGYWKVYLDMEGAKATFDQYNLLKRSFMEYILAGNKAEDYLYQII